MLYVRHICAMTTLFPWMVINGLVITGLPCQAELSVAQGVLGFLFHMKYSSNKRQRWLIKAPREYYGWLSLWKTILTLAYCYVCATFLPKVRHGVMYHESFMIVYYHNCTCIMTVIPQWYSGTIMVALVWKVIARSRTSLSGSLWAMCVISLEIILQSFYLIVTHVFSTGDLIVRKIITLMYLHEDALWWIM